MKKWGGKRLTLWTTPLASILAAFLLTTALFFSGCTQLEAQVEDLILLHTRSMAACSPESDVPHNGSVTLLDEAERQLASMTHSHYSHQTSVDEETGTYNYDCSGFVGYAMSRADPCAFSILLHERPNAAQFYYHLAQMPLIPGKGGWMRVLTPLGLMPGDIIVWLKPDESDAKSTGHIMIVAGKPVKDPYREGEVLVRVIDSTTSPHTDDTRIPGQTGLGKGTIGIMTDSSGIPTGYYWRGGVSTSLQETEMIFARIA